MNYSTGQQIKVGDVVIADGMTGLVVCDFDNQEFLDGYADWAGVIHDSETPYSGVLITTDEAGRIQYGLEDEGIVFVRSAAD